MDVVDRLEARAEPEPVEHAFGIGAVAVGEDELAPGQPRQRAGERLVARERVHFDVVDEAEELVRIDVVLGH